MYIFFVDLGAVVYVDTESEILIQNTRKVLILK